MLIAETQRLLSDIYCYVTQIVYVAPMKALAGEMVRNFGQRLSALGITVQELTGDMQLSKSEIMKTQVQFCCSLYSAVALLAVQSAVIATAIPSIHPSVARWYPIQTNDRRITGSSL